MKFAITTPDYSADARSEAYAPQIMDDGGDTESLSQAPQFSWSLPIASGSPVDYYEVAIGTSPGLTDTMPWRKVGTARVVELTGVSFLSGEEYFGSVRATAADGTVSNIKSGDGFRVITRSSTLRCSLLSRKEFGCRVNGTNAYSPYLRFIQPWNPGDEPGTYFDSDGILRSAAINFVRQSESLDQAVWSKTGLIVSPNAGLDPSGLNTAERIERDTDANGGATSTLSQAPPEICAGTTTVTESMYVKRGDHDWVQLSLQDGGSAKSVTAWFNLQTGEVGSYSVQGIAPAPSYIDHTMISVGNDWYRVTLTATARNGSCRFSLASSAGNTDTARAASHQFFYAWGGQLEVSAEASAYGTTTAGPSGVPRFDIDPKTTMRLGFVNESSKVNRMLHSGNLAHPVYSTSSGAVANPSAVLSPDSIQTATILTDNNISSDTFVSQSVSPGGAPTNYRTCSIFLKKGSAASSSLQIMMSGGSMLAATATLNWLDLSLSRSSINTLDFDVFSRDLGNDWVRLAVTARDTNNTSVACRVFPAGETIDGSSTGTVYAWGAQIENEGSESNGPSSYIPTLATAVARPTFSATIPAVSSFNSSEGTLLAQAISHERTASMGRQSIFSMESNSSNQAVIGRAIGNSAFGVYRETGANRLLATSSSEWLGGATVTSLISYKANAYAFCSGGMAGALTSPTGSVFTPTAARIGTSTGGNIFSGWVREIRNYPTQLDPATLCELTQQ